jgi:hypothetical protein
MSRSTERNQMSEQDKTRQGYSDCTDLLKNSTSIDQLEKAAKHVVKIIKDCKLDYIQEEKLEELGFRCYEKITRSDDEIIKNRKF